MFCSALPSCHFSAISLMTLTCSPPPPSHSSTQPHYSHLFPWVYIHVSPPLSCLVHSVCHALPVLSKFKIVVVFFFFLFEFPVVFFVLFIFGFCFAFRERGRVCVGGWILNQTSVYCLFLYLDHCSLESLCNIPCLRAQMEYKMFYFSFKPKY